MKCPKELKWAVIEVDGPFKTELSKTIMTLNLSFESIVQTRAPGPEPLLKLFWRYTELPGPPELAGFGGRRND